MKLKPLQSADDVQIRDNTCSVIEDIDSPIKKESDKKPQLTQITVVDHRTEKEVKVDAVKELIEKSKVSGG